MSTSRGRARHPLLLLAGTVVLVGCEQPLVVRAAPTPALEAQISAAATVAGPVDPGDLARARTDLDALVGAWRSPAAATLHEQGANARRDAERLAKTLDPRPDRLVAEAQRAAAAHPRRP